MVESSDTDTSVHLYDHDPSVKKRKVDPAYSRCNHEKKNISTHLIRSLIDTQVTKLYEQWNGSIPFQCLVYFGDENQLTTLPNGKFDNIDICDYLSGKRKPALRLYFDPNKYPPPIGKRQSTTTTMKNVVMC